VALINTDQPEGDSLANRRALDRFLAEWQWSGVRRGDERELAEVRSLRPRLRRIWTLDDRGVADEVNALLREGHALPQVVAHDGWPFHLHATPPDAPLADRMAVEAAMALVDVLRQDELGRLLICQADRCEDVLVDLSKNRSRRYCSTACTNRMNVAAYRSRRAVRDG
jgi:predicted RNA-binding Zn ribbon-like protein